MKAQNYALIVGSRKHEYRQLCHKASEYDSAYLYELCRLKLGTIKALEFVPVGRKEICLN